MTRYTITIYDAQSALNPDYMQARVLEDLQRSLSDTVNIEIVAQEEEYCHVCDQLFEVDSKVEGHNEGFCSWQCQQSLEDQPPVEDPMGTEEADTLARMLFPEFEIEVSHPPQDICTCKVCMARKRDGLPPHPEDPSYDPNTAPLLDADGDIAT